MRARKIRYLISELSNKSFHERIVIGVLLLEKICHFSLPWKILRKIINQAIYHVEIHPDSFATSDTLISLRLPHPYNIIIHRECRISENCTFFQNVTIGVIERQGTIIGPPVIHSSAYFGAGCVVLGNVIVGEHAKCGANAVILRDVGPYSTAVGMYK